MSKGFQVVAILLGQWCSGLANEVSVGLIQEIGAKIYPQSAVLEPVSLGASLSPVCPRPCESSSAPAPLLSSPHPQLQGAHPLLPLLFRAPVLAWGPPRSLLSVISDQKDNFSPESTHELQRASCISPSSVCSFGKWVLFQLL